MHSFSHTLSHTLLHFGLVGCMWSICGIHDQGWAERGVFGKIRYMNYKGCLRKFNVAQFERKYCPKSLWSTICLEGCVKSARQRGSPTPWPQGHFFFVTAFLFFVLFFTACFVQNIRSILACVDTFTKYSDVFMHNKTVGCLWHFKVSFRESTLFLWCFYINKAQSHYYRRSVFNTSLKSFSVHLYHFQLSHCYFFKLEIKRVSLTDWTALYSKAYSHPQWLRRNLIWIQLFHHLAKVFSNAAYSYVWWEAFPII